MVSARSSISSTASCVGGADAVLAASIFHFREHTIAEAKTLMAESGVVVRPVAE